MNHSFNVEVAMNVGVEKAVLIENIAFWINKNIANGKNFKDGETWTYNSTRAFSELFPYFNSKKISRLLNQLETDGYIKSGVYNKSGYDRTKWYTISNKWVKSLYSTISQKRPMEIPKASNGDSESVQTYNTDINQISPPLTPHGEKKSPRKNLKKDLSDYLVNKIDGTSFIEYQEKLLEFFEYRMSMPASGRYKTTRGIDGLLSSVGDLIRAGLEPVECLNTTMEEEWLKPKPDYFDSEKFRTLKIIKKEKSFWEKTPEERQVDNKAQLEKLR